MSHEQAARRPATPNEQAMLFLQRLRPDTAALTIPVVARIDGRLDRGLLRRVLDLLAERHPALRTTFPGRDGQIAEVASAGSPELRWRESRGEQSAEDFVREALARPFDPATGPLIRVDVLAAADAGRFVMTVHHLVADLWSMSVLADEFATAYAALAAGREPMLPAPAHKDPPAAPSGERRAESLAFWRVELAGTGTALELPAEGVRSRVPGLRGRSVPFMLDAELTRTLQALGRENGATLYSVLLSALQLVLWRYTGSEEVAVGTPVHGRGRDTMRAVGLFANTVVMRGRVHPDETFRSWVRRNHQATRAALNHADLPFGELVTELTGFRDPGHAPLVQVIFNLMRAPHRRAETISGFAVDAPAPPLDLGPVRLFPEPAPPTRTQVDLTLDVTLTGGEIRGDWIFDADVLSGATVRALGEHLRHLLRTAAAGPDVPVLALPLMTAADAAAAVLRGVDGAERADDTVPTRILAAARRFPDRIAVSGDDAELTYRQLISAATSVATRLRAAGAGSESLVGIHLRRGARLVAAALGAWLAGCAYLPLDPELPPGRLAYLLSVAQPAIVLTDRTGSGALPSTARATVLPTVTELAGAADAEQRAFPAAEPGQLAYVIYTSGSTGAPKAVMVTHRQLANVVEDAIHRFRIGPTARMLAVTTFSFDIAALEIFTPLVAGGRTELAPARVVADGTWLWNRLQNGDISHLQATPVTWRALLDHGWDHTAPVTVLCGGESMPAALADDLCRVAPEVWNLYGPTETTIWSTADRLGPGRTATIGTPLRGTRAYVLDRYLAPAPTGVVGELYLAGAGVARGYLGRPGTTAERFLPDLWGPPGARMYRTGDLVRRRSDGRLHFVGRADNQVKVNGLRVELGEVEAHLARLPGVAGAVAARHEGAAGASLTGYLLPDPGVPVAGLAELRRTLAAILPAYLVPSRLFWIDRFPLTANGKVDRRALPDPDTAAPKDATAPGDPLEQLLHEYWRSVLPGSDFGVHEDLYDLGAHSLPTMRVAALVAETLPVEVSLADLLERRTVAAQARMLLDAGHAAGMDVVAAAELALRVAAMPDEEVERMLAELDGHDEPRRGADG